MPVAGPLIGAGAGILGAVIGSRGASSAADTAAQSAQAGIDEQRRQYDLSRQDLAPWRRAGVGALRTLSADFGDSFQTSPGYEFVRNEGLRNLGNQLSTGWGGGVYGGNALSGAARYTTGLASQEYGNWWNRGAGLADIGQSATNTGVQAGQQSANNISNLYGQQGDARGSGIAAGANIWGNALGSIGQGFGDYYSQHPYLGRNPGPG